MHMCSALWPHREAVNLLSLQGPQLVIVVPTRELGVQTVMLIYQLFGGSVNAGIPGDPTNMFAYTGPRGIRVSIYFYHVTPNQCLYGWHLQEGNTFQHHLSSSRDSQESNLLMDNPNLTGAL